MTSKITISLPDDLVEEARAAVEAGQAASVSGYIATAMRSYADRDTWQRFMADLDELHGRPSPEDRAWARAQLGLEADAG